VARERNNDQIRPAFPQPTDITKTSEPQLLQSLAQRSTHALPRSELGLGAEVDKLLQRRGNGGPGDTVERNLMAAFQERGCCAAPQFFAAAPRQATHCGKKGNSHSALAKKGG
jgi:hypothetical protein